MTRFATFNVLSGRSVADGRADARRFAGAVASLDADVLVLQEVDRDQERSGRLDLTAIAAEAMGASHAVFAPALYGTPGRSWKRADDGDDPGGPAYGNALLSRLPWRDLATVRMPAAPVVVPLFVPGHGAVLAREEPRVATVATVETPTGEVTVVGTHLPFVPGWNRRQLRKVAEALVDRPDPLLFMGDLNLRGSTPAKLTGWRPLVEAPTFPVDRPRWQLDHVLLRGDLGGIGSVQATDVRALPVSDHRAVTVDIG